jgi:DNA modification methylase
VPGFVGEVMTFNLATAVRPQPVLALAGALSLQAVLAARKVRDERGNRTNLYAVGVAPSGGGKDHARKVNRNVLFQAGLDHLEGSEGLASDAGLVTAVAAQPGILFQIDEFGRFLRTAGDPRKAPHLFNVLTTLMKLYSAADTVFRGKAYADRKRNQVIDQPCAGVYGTTVPEHFYEALTAEALGDGFVARLLVFEGDERAARQRVPQAPVPAAVFEAARWWGGFTPGGNLGQEHPQPLTVATTAEAGQVFDGLAAVVDREQARPGLTPQSLWARAEEKACRLALVYACSADRAAPVIDAAAAARWACAVSEYLTRRLEWLAQQWVADGQFDARQKKVLRIIREAGGAIGHTRYKAALKLGLEEVPVHVAAGLSPAQAKAYRIADNQMASLSQWDDAKLPLELAESQGLDFDLSLTGFSADELTALLAPAPTEGEADPDAVPEPPDEAVTRPGDLWLLGRHRLLCGDSSKAEEVDRLLDGAAIHLVNTDPPYNVKVEPRSNNAIAAGLSSFAGATHHQALDVARHPQKSQPTTRKLRAKDRPLANDFVSEAEFDRLLHAWFGNLARVLLPGRAFYIWGGYANCAKYPPVLKAAGLYFSQAIIWDKQHPVLTRKDYMGAHEWCFYGWKEGAAHQFFGPANVTDLWAVKKVNPQSMIHLTEKPVELAERAMQYSSRPGEHVLDLFGGSGSTLIAAERTGRTAYLMELDPLYADVIVQRYEDFTGQKAERVPTVA